MKTVVISLLGTSLDRRGKGEKRWDKWRPNVSLCGQDDLIVDRLDLLFGGRSQGLADQVTEDIAVISPETQVCHHRIRFDDPWDFETVFSTLLDFARSYPFNSEAEDYLIHITTGTHVAQICLYLLTEARYFPGRLLQTSPATRQSQGRSQYQIIDLDLSKYDQIASRFIREQEEGTAYLKGGIQTRNPAFNRMIEQIEQVSIRSTEPILLTGLTGAGKSQLARRVFSLKQQRGQITGRLVEVNCATLRGENAMSSLFGHKKGAFTGAISARSGLLKEADNGLLFLDEIGELGLDEQAMLLGAIEDKRFMPMGADHEESSNFQLIAGTNREILSEVHSGRFREDLLARINLWSYEIPSLRHRLEDLEPNIEFELERWAQRSGQRVSFNKSARQLYLRFARSGEALWSANFRDLNASMTRMATLAPGGRINESIVNEEIARLKKNWVRYDAVPDNTAENLIDLFGEKKLSNLDLFDRIQLLGVVRVCRESGTLAEAGRKLFAHSRKQKKSANDSHRVRQYLSRFDLSFETLISKRLSG